MKKEEHRGRPRIPDDIRSKVVALNLAGESQMDIAKTCQISIGSVHNILETAETKKKKTGPSKINDHVRNQVVALKSAHVKYKDIAKTCQISIGSVHNILYNG